MEHGELYNSPAQPIHVLTLRSSLLAAHRNPGTSPWSHLWASHHRNWSRLQMNLAARRQCWGLCAGWHVLRKEDGGMLQDLTSDVLNQHWACHCTAQQERVQWVSTMSILHHSASCKSITHFHITNQLTWLLMAFLFYTKCNPMSQHKLAVSSVTSQEDKQLALVNKL